MLLLLQSIIWPLQQLSTSSYLFYFKAHHLLLLKLMLPEMVFVLIEMATQNPQDAAE